MSEEKQMSASEKKKEDWMNSKWRPMMGWMYMIVCFMDMVIFPILWSLLQTVQHQQLSQWNPLTLQGAGLFHIAMGAVLGIAAYGRTQEKLGGANNGGLQTPTSTGASSFGSTSSAPSSVSTFGSTPSVSAPSGFGAVSAPAIKPTPAAFGSAPSTGFGAGLDPSDPPARNTRND